jgi:hypothetical protein
MAAGRAAGFAAAFFGAWAAAGQTKITAASAAALIGFIFKILTGGRNAAARFAVNKGD